MAFTPTGVQFVAKGLSGYLSDLKTADQAGQKLGSGFAKAGGLIKNAGLAAAAAGTAAVAAVGTGLAAGLVASTKTAIDFESAFAGVLKTVDDFKTPDGVETLRQELVDLTKQIPLTFEEIAQIGELGGQLGVGSAELAGFTETIAMLGTSTNLSTEEAATSIARMSNIFGVEKANIDENALALGNTIVKLGNNFATTERDITAFGLRLAGAGNIAGLTQADVLAIGAAMSSVGVEAEAGGTATQKVLLAINNAVNGTEKGFVDNSKAIDTNIKKLTKLQAESARLEAQFPGLQNELVAQYDAFIAAGGSAEDFGRQLGDKTRQKAFETAQEIARLTGETDLLRQSQGQPIDPGQLTTFARVAGVTADEFKALWQEDASQAFQLFVEGLGREGDNAVNVLEELDLTDQRLIRSFLSLSGASGELERAFQFANEEFENGTALQDEAAKRYETTASKIQILKNNVRAFGDQIGRVVLPYLNKLIDYLGGLVDQYGPQLVATLEQSVIPAIQEWAAYLGPIIDQIFELGQSVLSFIQNIDTGDGSIFETLFDPVKLQQAINDIIAQVPSFLSSLVVSITNFLRDQGPSIAQTVRDWQDRFWEWVQNAVSVAGQNLAALIGAITTWATSAETQAQLTALGQQLGYALVEYIKFAFENQEQIISVMTKLVEGLAAAVVAVTGLIVLIGAQIVAGILQSILEELGINLQPATISELGSILKGIADNALLAAKIIGTNIIDGIIQGWNDLKLTLAQSALDLLDYMLTSVKSFLGIASPSSLFADIGIGIVEGLIQGIQSLASSVGEAITGIFDFLFGGGDEASTLPDVSGFNEQMTQAQMILAQVKAALELIIQHLGVTLPEMTLVFFGVFQPIWLQVNTILQQTIMLLTQIATVWLIQVQTVSIATTQTMITGFTQVNTVLQQTISLLNAIVVALQAVAAAAKKAVEELLKMEDAHEPLKKLKKLVDAATESFKKMAEAAKEAARAASDAGTTSEAQTGIGFQTGTLGFKVPPGFPQDSFRIGVTSGEEVIVAPRGRTIEDIFAARFMSRVEPVSMPSGVVSRQVSVNFGTVNINNGMDISLLQNIIRQTVSEGL